MPLTSVRNPDDATPVRSLTTPIVIVFDPAAPPVDPAPDPPDEPHAVRAAQAAVKQAEYELDRSHAQRLPSVDLVATYGGNYAGGNINEPLNFGTNVHDRQVSIQISLPLLDGGGMHAQVVEARAQRAKAQSDLSAAQRKVTLDTRLAYAAVLSGISQARALEAALAAGQSSVKGNRIGYGLGIRINSDVLNAEQQLYATRQDLDKACYDTLFAGLKLKAAAGELSAEDLKGVNLLFLSASPTTSADGASSSALQEQPR